MATPFHSIVMISYNQHALVADAVRSVREQDDGDWEIIAVDDGSTDGTLAVLQQLAADDARIIVVAKENTRLPSIARNAGLARTTGRIVSFLDGDDTYAPGRLRRIRSAFNACPEANILFGDYKPFGMPQWDAITGGYLEHNGMAERYAALGERRPGGETCIPADRLLPVQVCEFFGAFTLNIAVRRDVIVQRHLRFDEKLLMAEDHDFVVRAMDGGTVLFVPEILGYWLRQPSTISSKPNAKGYRDAFEVLERHMRMLPAEDITPAARAKVRQRLANHAFEWGYASAQLRNFAEARQAYRASFRYGPERRKVIAWAKAMLHLSRSA